jgi:c-di-GMP-binding flagellar brake protein YcgR
MNVEGAVCYNCLSENEEHRLGIRFTQISEKDKKAITDFIKLSPLKKI